MNSKNSERDNMFYEDDNQGGGTDMPQDDQGNDGGSGQ